MPFQSNTALVYDIAWDDGLTNILHILQYSLILTAGKGASNVLSTSFWPVYKPKFLPQWYLLFHLTEYQYLILELMFWKFYNAFTFILERKN